MSGGGGGVCLGGDIFELLFWRGVCGVWWGGGLWLTGGPQGEMFIFGLNFLSWTSEYSGGALVFIFWNEDGAEGSLGEDVKFWWCSWLEEGWTSK